MTERFATIDIGTNTVLCLIAEKRDQNLHTIEDEASIVRLGEGLNNQNTLSENAIQRTLVALQDFRNLIDQHKVPNTNLQVLATASLRKASNASVFLDEAKKQCDFNIQIISGKDEAHYSYLGVRHGLEKQLQNAATPHVSIIDIGGGSTELLRHPLNVETNAAESAESLHLGSVWLTETFLQDKDPPTEKALEAMNQEIMQRLNQAKIDFKEPSTWVGIAGTVTTLAAMNQNLDTYDATKVHGAPLNQEEIRHLLNKMTNMPLSERKKLKGIEAKRADVIIAGTSILLGMMQKANTDTILVCDQGLRYGALWAQMVS